MKRTLLIALICFRNLFSIAQSTTWCPPGAQWHYGFHNFYIDGYTELNYVSDTIIGGTPCHKLMEHSKYLYHQNGVIYNDYFPQFTYDSNGVVYGLTSTNDWDTLFDFNAVPNDTWKIFELDSTNYVQVIDTGHNTIQGFNLKWMTVTYQSGNPTSVPDTIYERLGCIGYNYPFGSSVGSFDPDIWGFCNYSDSYFQTKKLIISR